jgi:hydrophobe/amphiphile efflux-1 (HAE1) family protein
MTLTEACIRKPVFAWMIMAATVVFGAVAISRIGVSQYPDVDYPTITVSVSWEGASPEVMENDVVELLEEAVAQVEGIRAITSVSRQGSANVTVELDISRDVDVALQDVQTRVAQQRLPRDVDPPVISKSNPEDQPIMWVGVYGPFAPQLLADLARYRVKDRLQAVPGVGEVMLGGYRERAIRVWINADRLDQHGLTVRDVIRALGREHVEMPAGLLETQSREVGVRVMGEALDLATLRGLVVAERSGQPVTLDEVALVEDGFEDERRRARMNGIPVQGMGIKKQRGANAVAVAQGVRAALAEVSRTLPDGMEAGVMFDSTTYIEESVREVEWELLAAVVLTALVCWMFLGSLSSTLNVILAIPMSLMGTIATIYFLGYTLNTFTLLALSLAVGIVVDDAIMVMENIFRHAEAGKVREQAAREGTQEIAFAALAATIAVIAIFLPVVFVDGILGKFLLQFGVTLSVAVALSYLEAITLAPARCAQLLKTGRDHRTRLGQLVDRGFEALARAYGFALGKSLRWPLLALAGAGLLMVLAWHSYRALPSEMVPSQDQGRLLIRLQTAPGSSLDDTDLVSQRAEALITAKPEVRRLMFIVGGFGGGANQVIAFVTLTPRGERRKSQAEIQQALRKELNGIPGVRAVVQDLSQQGFSAQRGFPIEFSLRGSDWPTLVSESQRLREALAASGVAVDVDSDYQLGAPELRIVPDRERAADLGVPVEEIAAGLSAMVGGVRVGKYSTAGRRVDVRVKLLAAQRMTPTDLDRLRVRSQSGELHQLGGLVAQDERPALQAVTRKDRERAISIFANPAPGHSQQEALAVVEGLAKGLPPGLHVVLGGQSEAFRKSSRSLLFAIGLGILVAYMVLASQFNSFLHPVTVLTILPLSVAGALFALELAGRGLNLFSAIGLFLLMGIVKKNSIILVDYALQKRREGLSARDAMLAAGPTRLRPILMTSISTLMAAVPAALALGSGSEVRAPMAVAVIGGLLVSTVLSLFVVPAFYVVADSALARVRAWRGAAAPGAAARPEAGGSSG